MVSFSNWLLQKESTAVTRRRKAATAGTMTWAGSGSLHGHSTASPNQVKSFKKFLKKKFRASANGKKISPQNHNKEVDNWVKEVGGLKDALLQLKQIFDKKKQEKGKEDKKPEDSKKDQKDSKSKSDDDKNDTTDDIITQGKSDDESKRSAKLGQQTDKDISDDREIKRDVSDSRIGDKQRLRKKSASSDSD